MNADHRSRATFSGSHLHEGRGFRNTERAGSDEERITLATSIEPHDLPGRFQVPRATAGTKASSPSGRNGSVRPCSALM